MHECSGVKINFGTVDTLTLPQGLSVDPCLDNLTRASEQVSLAIRVCYQSLSQDHHIGICHHKYQCYLNHAILSTGKKCPCSVAGG